MTRKKLCVLFGIFAGASAIIGLADQYLGPNTSHAHLLRVPPTHEAPLRAKEKYTQPSCTYSENAKASCLRPPTMSKDDAIQIAVRLILLEALAGKN